VVEGANRGIEVKLSNKHNYTAKVVGTDKMHDLALLQIDAPNLEPVTLADSTGLSVGQKVFAIGNPFGLSGTMTRGIISSIRSIRGSEGAPIEDAIQTDAAINPGNSGGALVDIQGRLIGINTAILSRSGGSQGLGFAVPADIARSVMQSLVAYGHVTRGYLGVMIQNVTPALAEEFKLKETKGALISEVTPDGAAAKAGLKDGDVVLEFNGKPVADSHHLQLAVADIKPGSAIPVEILRNGEKETLKVTVQEFPGKDQLAENESGNSEDTGTLNGVGVADVDAQVRSEYNIPRHVTGAVITQVDPSSPSADAGLKPGVVIEEINHHPVKSADEAVKLTTHPDNKRTLLRIWVNGGSHYVVVDESKNG